MSNRSNNGRIRSILPQDMHLLGIDYEGRLYWDGKPVVTSPISALTRGQKIIAAIMAAATIFGGIGGAVQGWTAYHSWACVARPNWFAVCGVEQTVRNEGAAGR
ncbi:hypothetical protein [Methylosinus sp. Sm6]|uniref:hypothetical protein n=1 Tax=Methylosinus sp. Sm6 TaxID=2866948 RepID=UPI001C99C06B|nr:hypothetical protein [Methylosinus sp. Sm6]MBY6242054.1 hypothetical protein [Methylosinus sp. Sm6]